jgi:hypothetical protein
MGLFVLLPAKSASGELAARFNKKYEAIEGLSQTLERLAEHLANRA